MGIFNKFKDTFTSDEFDDIEKDLVKAISIILAVTPPVQIYLTNKKRS